jgi:5-methylcytosine-specific restriction endonuclease McrA
MSFAKMIRAAESDSTFELRGRLWVGKCLICNGPIAFDAGTGEGASLEHIRAKSRGGSDELENLALAHARCNSQKGIAWDQKRRKNDEEYELMIKRLLERRRSRWREKGGPPG